MICVFYLSSCLFRSSSRFPSFFPPSCQCVRQIVAVGELVSLPVVVLAALMVSHVHSCISRVGRVRGRETDRACVAWRGVLDALAPALAFGNPLGTAGRTCVWVCFALTWSSVMATVDARALHSFLTLYFSPCSLFLFLFLPFLVGVWASTPLRP